MTYTITLSINAPLELVQELLTATEHQLQWRKWAISIEQLEKNKEGIAAAKYTYIINERKTTIKEVVLIDNLPSLRKIKAYYSIGASAIEETTLIQTENKTTTLVLKTMMKSENFGIKILMWLLPSLFKKQSQMLLEQLKEYAESKHLENK